MAVIENPICQLPADGELRGFKALRLKSISSKIVIRQKVNRQK